MANYETIIGIVAGILSGISMLPQLVKIVEAKKADDVSMPMLLVLISGLACWIWYGLLKSDWPIVITNSFSVMLNAVIIGLKLHYKN